MAVIALAGGPGAPGVTTTALALLLAWPLQVGRRVILAECDPDGGAVLAGALAGRTPGPYGLRNLAVADRQGQLGEAFWRQLIDLSDEGTDRLLLPGLTDPAQASSLAYTWEKLAALFAGIERTNPSHDVIVDLGRSGAFGASAPLARKADAVLMVVRPTLRGIHAAQPRIRALRADLEEAGTGADALGIVVVDHGMYSVSEVSQQLGTPVIMRLPHSPQAAAVLSDGHEAGRGFKRSDLLRASRSGADQILQHVRGRRARLMLGEHAHAR
ncbi:hypothetical protein J7F01_08850 [Streptomyces sp. ISL-22]|uniref:hypothetical protein n=1 Tax=unclassified Streptomyces TaxID=2593676 RepID=UPI001BECE565|nr:MULTISPECIES: hypothetical protein [unclassified Streptomyces]MBT2418015.1 hypothetical protein [Streptomyces sp. ISL-24]MBT2432310.1 hypothetical protein [Streptomyces sp. ISL-22]